MYVKMEGLDPARGSCTHEEYPCSTIQPTNYIIPFGFLQQIYFNLNIIYARHNQSFTPFLFIIIIYLLFLNNVIVSIILIRNVIWPKRFYRFSLFSLTIIFAYYGHTYRTYYVLRITKKMTKKV